ncbi:head-tail joining protein [Iodobacter fluviatilis]|uniref:Uncharacterized protein n=1 Tax=Iodobacter fluviatilis TaxID=537 RepID=A0A7G3GB84_9NEIS|nr:hypothetical protein [Iodobacter fluviatilis]QBC44459.1 hypothetical protein C1H71_13575 [Iodobacter fluviatilis]
MKEPLGVFFADFGEILTFGPLNKRVLFESEPAQGVEGFMLSNSSAITYKQLDFPGMKNGSEVQFRAKSWRIENAGPDGDGALWRADLVAV